LIPYPDFDFQNSHGFSSPYNELLQFQRRDTIDARLGIAYTDHSVAARLGRSFLPSSFSDSEQAKGRLETGQARVCFPEKIT
jgi:hypothetical protein